MNRADRAELRTLAVALLVSLLLWNLPFGGVLLYPFKLLATWLHELSHALVMTIAGAGFDHIVIYRDASGLAYSDGTAGAVGSAFVAAAGYMGTPLWGALLLAVTRTPRAARIALVVVAVLLVVSAITVVAIADGDAFGPLAIAGIGGGFLIAGLALPAPWRMAVAHFIAAQACVNALLDIRVLFRPSQVVGGRFVRVTDATNMAYAAFGTTEPWAVWTWASIWLAWSLAVLFVALKLSGSRTSSRAAPLARTTASLRDESDRDGHRRSPATAPDETARNGPADTGGS